MDKQTLIVLSPTFGKPETVPARKATPEQLYDAWDAWRLHKVRYGQGQSEGAMHAKTAAKEQIERIKRELKRRKLPMDRLLWEKRRENGPEWSDL